MVKQILRRAGIVFVLLTALAYASPGTLAQEEGEPTVVDEVIAQVNNDVITLSMVKREIKEAADQMRSRGMAEAEANAKAATMQNEIIVSLINEQLLIQKGKDLNMTDDVEAEVNRRLLQIAKEQGIDTIEKLDAALTASGLSPSDIRQTMRKEIMKNMVFNNEVDRRVYFGLGPEEVKRYYEAHKEKFRKPETYDLSEIFLSLAGKPEADVRTRAAQIVAQARKPGADFGTLAVANSEREQNGVRIAPSTKGKLGRVQGTDISRPEVSTALKGLQTGGVTEPIKIDEGLLILRVDEFTTGGEPVFNENRVREVMTMERAEKERTGYLKTLRDEAYVKIAKDYQSAIEPLLNKSTPAAATAEKAQPQDAKKERQ